MSSGSRPRSTRAGGASALPTTRRIGTHIAGASVLAATLVAAALPACRLVGGGGAEPTATDADNPSPANPSVEGSAALRRAIESAGRGVDDPGLRDILQRDWARRLAEAPTFATTLGVHDYDDRLPDEDPATLRARSIARGRTIREVREVAVSTLSARDQVTHALLLENLETAASAEVCRDADWNLGVHDNPVSHVLDLPEKHPMRSPEDGAKLVARNRAVPTLIEQNIASLRLGAADGLYGSQASLQRVVELIDRALAEPLETTPLLAPARDVPAAWSGDARRRFREELTAAVSESVTPAFTAFREFVATELVPNGRTGDREGIGVLALGGLEIGAECYAARIRQYTTLVTSADEVHRIGLEEIARIDAELVALGASALSTKDLPSTLEALRNDPALFFASEAEVEKAARDSLAAAKQKIPEFFGLLPKADCVVRPVPAFEAPLTHIGYYDPPHVDGSKPGEYWVNTYAPKTRPRYEARVLAVHESIPGHHLQIAIGQELTELPVFRRHGGYGAYVEGWALYTERLAEQMGLYETDLDRFGMLSFDAWRAARLVVDTGIHAKGWTRAQAEQYMVEHTALTPGNIANEVDRYIGWPGQALGYKIGQRHILGLRAQAQAALGESFSLPGFHDAVLGGGPVTLEVLSARVQAWIETERIAAERAG